MARHRGGRRNASDRLESSARAAPTVSSDASRVLAPIFAGLLLLTGLICYHNSLHAVFTFDDLRNIQDNLNIRGFLPVSKFFHHRRPLVLFSLAVNYSFHGKDVYGYHVFNLAIHIAAALVLFDLVRRTLRLPRFDERTRRAAPWLAFIVALLWIVHPLQTGAVTYLIQRAESMMALFYLLTLYCLLRAAELNIDKQQNSSGALRALDARPAALLWLLASVLAFALGLGCKAVIATAPLAAFLFDAAILAGDPVLALRRRWPLYLALSVMTFLFAFVGPIRTVFFPTGRGAPTVGFGYEGIDWLSYARTQPEVILHYLELVFWPRDLCLDYQWAPAASWGEAAAPTLVLDAIFASTVVALIRRPPIGFVAILFFIILAPTSSVIPIKDLAFEHRMYLPLASVILLVVLGAWQLMTVAVGLPGRNTPPSPPLAGGEKYALAGGEKMGRAAACGLALLLAVALAHRTIRRNEDYKSSERIWRDVVRQRPDNGRALSNLGRALIEAGRYQESIDCCQESLTRNPHLFETFHALNNICNAYVQLKQFDKAVEYGEKALAQWPRFADAHNNLAAALRNQGRIDEAIDHCRKALQFQPNFPEAHVELGTALKAKGLLTEALAEYDEALRLKPELAKTHHNAALIYKKLGRLDEAIARYRQALLIDDSLFMTRNNLGNALLETGRIDEAINELRRTVEQNPDYLNARLNLGRALAAKGDPAAALQQYEVVLSRSPNSPDAHFLAAQSLHRLGRTPQAVSHYQTTLRLQPDHLQASQALREIGG